MIAGTDDATTTAPARASAMSFGKKNSTTNQL
jgi:hypothetical protein